MKAGFKCTCLGLLMIITLVPSKVGGEEENEGHITCYHCSAEDGSKCDEDEPRCGIACYDSDNLKKNEMFKVCRDKMDNLCFKLVHKFGDLPKRIERGCTHLNMSGPYPDMHVPVNSCRFVEAETNYEGISSELCWCDKDLCNLGHHLHASFSALVVAIASIVTSFYGTY